MSYIPRISPGQRGISTVGLVGIIIGVGVVFLSLFIFAGTSGPRQPASQEQSGTNSEDAGSTEDDQSGGEPAYIRIPENSLIYKNSTYAFSFAYPSSFEKLTDKNTAGQAAGKPVFQAASANAVQKPVGTSGATLTGPLGTYVYKKDDFKIVVAQPDIYVSATKTGNDTTWKIISRGNTTQDVSIGDSYPVKTIRSQTGVPVFDFSYKIAGSQIGRYVFELDKHYVIIALPQVSRGTDGNVLSEADVAAYNVIGNNIASTVRVKETTATQN